MSDDDKATEAARDRAVYALGDRLEAAIHKAICDVTASEQSPEVVQAATVGALSQILVRAWVAAMWIERPDLGRSVVVREVVRAICDSPWERSAGAVYDTLARMPRNEENAS